MVEIANHKQLEAWLETERGEVAAAIAVRCALCVLPTIAGLVSEHRGERSTTIVLPLFRGIAAPWLASKWPSRGAALGSKLDAAAHSARAAQDATQTTNAAEDAARATLAVQDATRAARAAAHATRATIHAAHAAVHTADAEIWDAITVDTKVIETDRSREKLMRCPLWIDTIPDWVVDLYRRLASELLGLDENWEVWTRWYEDRLFPTDKSRRRPLIEQLEVDRVMIPGADWAKGPKHVNAII